MRMTKRFASLCEIMKNGNLNFTGSGSNFVLTSPGVTLQFPGGQKPLGAAVCKSYGGDANGNGLCDAWEKPLLASSGSAACGAPPPQIELVGLKVLDANRVRVEFTRSSGSGDPAIDFVLDRADLISSRRTRVPTVKEGLLPAPAAPPASAVSATAPPEECRPSLFEKVRTLLGDLFGGDAPVASVRRVETVVLRANVALQPTVQEQPWLVVSGFRNGVALESTAACKQAVPVPSYVRFKTDFDAGKATGIYGPYKDADLAASDAEPTARTFVDAHTHFLAEREAAGLILRYAGTGQYYVSQFELGDHSYTTPSVGGKEVQRSLDRSFVKACELRDDMQAVAFFHTHPAGDDNNKFSDDDWRAAFCQRLNPAWSSKFFKGSYLFRPDGCIDMIDGTALNRNDKLVVRVKSKACTR